TLQSQGCSSKQSYPTEGPLEQTWALYGPRTTYGPLVDSDRPVRTVTRRIEDIAGNLELQLQHEVASFDFISLALDESCDVRDTAQLLVFVRGITPDFKITEELAAMRPMKGTTTGSDLFTEEHETEHSDIGYHTAVRWLSLGKVLKRVWDLKAEIQEFCEKKGKYIPELSDEDWMADFAFAVDVTALMNELNTKLQ
ncbi:hypothetical protein JOQ06_016223, partial [Pogonophryne albipinna]